MDEAVRENLEEILLHARRAVGLRGQRDAALSADDWESLYLCNYLIQIIGERAMRLRKAAPEVLEAIDQPWFKIIAVRHIIAHNYEGVDASRIDTIITDELPGLIEAVGTYLETQS